MLHIKRQNGKVQYAFEPNSSTNVFHYDLESALLPHPRIHNHPQNVQIDKWYITHRHEVDTIIEIYVTKFQEFVATHPRYNVNLYVDEFRDQLIKKLYASSQSRKKTFI